LFNNKRETTSNPILLKEVAMALHNPFSAEGQWYRGNLHTHTTVSDGSLPVQETCALYRNKGYDFLAITDHDAFFPAETFDKNLLVLPGIEIKAGCTQHIVLLNPVQAGETRHLPMNDLPRFLSPDTYTIAAHPYWSGLTSGDVATIPFFNAVEAFNGVCHRTRGKGFSSIHWDELLHTERFCHGVAVDDIHSVEDCGKGWVMVKAVNLTTKEIIASLKKGLFYASTGVEITHLEYHKTTVTIETADPFTAIDFIGIGPSGSRIASTDNKSTQAEFSINPAMKYLRIEITNAAGQKAWVNPISIP